MPDGVDEEINAFLDASHLKVLATHQRLAEHLLIQRFVRIDRHHFINAWRECGAERLGGPRY